ncbi:MAG: histidine phosphotransferase family protein [Alphaproteobacteria bacterium]|nr:histidine phosphotransferase family protein [Alphaproteobacteria bacterium]
MMDASKLAAYVASRICHDMASPLTPLTMMEDTLFTPGLDEATRRNNERTVLEAVAKMQAKVILLRFAMGGEAINDDLCSVPVAEDRLKKFFASVGKAELDWNVGTQRISNRQMRLLMNMALIMMDPAARGVCRVAAREADNELLVTVDAVGRFSPIKPQVLEALEGREPADGWNGGTIQPYFARVLADEIGFALVMHSGTGQSTLTARGPLADV